MEFKVITYNVDGLPETLDLNDLPWVFKPIVWLYKQWKGTTIVRINDNKFSPMNAKNISKYLESTGADIIGVQEDFEYNTELMECLDKYNSSIYTGSFNLSKIFSSMTWFPIPRFKADGLNVITKRDAVEVKNEEIISWRKSYGYFFHANDKLTHKGFRACKVAINGVDIDVYVLHMDADFYSHETCPDVSKDVKARESQLKQLVKYILERAHPNPIIIMGDTNSTDKYQWDVWNINEFLLKPINECPDLYIKEAIPTNGPDVDRVFYINNVTSPYELIPLECRYDSVEYSDHKPLIATFEVKYKSV